MSPRKSGESLFVFPAVHGCLGEQFGFLQVKTIVSLLLRRFEIEPLCALPEPNYKVMVVGRELVSG